MSNARELAELGGSYGSGGFVGMKNRIINGAMVIDQRNAGASVTNDTSDKYPVDRIRIIGSQASKFTAQRSTTAPAGFTNSVLVTSSSAYTVGSAERFVIGQYIEGLNVTDLGFGTANASPVTLSFWVRSSLTGTFGGALRNSAGDRSYPFSFTINSANTFEYKTITISGDTSGTWLTDNGVGLHVTFNLGSGSTYLGTAGAWAAASYFAPTGATSVVGTSGATFYITGVQLEKGSTATSFDYRPYGTEFMLCQRYYVKYSATSSGPLFGYSAASSATQVSAVGNFPVEMRSAPSFDYSSIQISTASGGTGAVTSNDGITSTTSTYRAFLGVSGGGLTTNTYPYFLRASGTGWIAFSAEL